MKKILYLTMVLFTVFTLIACDDDDEKQQFSGKWNYERPHFEFDYASDSISIEMYRGKKMTKAVKDLKPEFMAMASDKMGLYFEGIEFLSDNQLAILAKMQSGRTMTLHAAYLYSADIIQVTLNKEEMKLIMGEKADMIPSISFKYFLSEEDMTLYFDQAYLRTLYSTMEAQIVPLIVQMMGIDFSHMPEGTEQEVIKGIKRQIPLILDNILKLEIGFVLKQA